MSEVSGSVGLLINNDPVEQAVFAWAFNEICPNSVCCVASCEEEAINIIEVAGVRPDFIVIEHDLPGLDIERLLKRLRGGSPFPGVPIMIHARRGDRSVLQRMPYPGAFAIYQKSLSFENVKALLHLYLLAPFGPISPN